MYYNYLLYSTCTLTTFVATDSLNIQLQFQNYAMHAKYTGVSVSGLFIWLTVLSSVWFVYILWLFCRLSGLFIWLFC